MFNLESFDGSDLRIIHPLIMRYNDEGSKRMKLFIIEKIDKEIIRVKNKLKDQLEVC
jgi:GDP-D-mannose dehydratase